MYPTLSKVAHTLFRLFWLLPVVIFALFHFYFPPMFLVSIIFHLFELSIYLVLSSLRDPILYNYGIYYKLCCPLGDFVSHDPSLATYFYMEVLLILYPLITIPSLLTHSCCPLEVTYFTRTSVGYISSIWRVFCVIPILVFLYIYIYIYTH